MVIYAKKLLEDNQLFEQHKVIIESQMKSSRELFGKMFQKEFKKNARTYLRELKIVKN